jgi:hypothetical protein
MKREREPLHPSLDIKRVPPDKDPIRIHHTSYAFNVRYRQLLGDFVQFSAFIMGKECIVSAVGVGEIGTKGIQKPSQLLCLLKFF